jgi:hypothetical protein
MSDSMEVLSSLSRDSAAVQVEECSDVTSQVQVLSSDGDVMTDAAAPPPSSSSPSASARRCNCKNSRCLKLYCECFAAGSYCNTLCKCKCCLNTKRHMSERQAAIKATLERNAFAFQPKISSAPASEKQVEDAGRHLKGCNCKKSNCLKKYCECFQAGVVCSSSCKCVDCLNFEGDALAAAKCRVPDRDRSKPSPKPLKRKASHASSSSKVMSWDAAFRSARAEPSDASLQLQGCLRRGGSFESKIFGDDFFEAIQHAPAVKDAFALGGSKGVEALLGFLNPLLEAVAERATREVSAAVSSGSGIGAHTGHPQMNGHDKDEQSEHAESELSSDDAAEDDEEAAESAETDADDLCDSDDGLRPSRGDDDLHHGQEDVKLKCNGSSKLQGSAAVAAADVTNRMDFGSRDATAVEDDNKSGS